MSHRKTFKMSEVYQMPYEMFRIDFETFQTIFVALSPWGKGVHGETLAMGVFKVKNNIKLDFQEDTNITL